MINVKQPLLLVLGLAVVLPSDGRVARAARTRDVCIVNPTGGGTFNTFIFRDVEPLSAGGAITVRGLYFAGSSRVAPFHGSAIMAMDGAVRLGLFVHSTAESTNDFTVAGVTDTNFVGTLSYDNDGDFVTNGTLAMQAIRCDALAIP